MSNPGLPYRLRVEDNSGISRVSSAGDGLMMFPKASNLTTIGAGTLLAAYLLTGLLLRTGPTGAYADTIDTGANLDAAFPNAQVGDSITLMYSNSVAFASTITAAAGVTLKTATANNVVAASTGRFLVLIKTGVATYDLYVI
jgi:hypothetical protein